MKNNGLLKKIKSIFLGSVFVFLFVAQGAISETFTATSLVNPYWVLIIFLILVSYFFIIPPRRINREAKTYAMTVALFAIFTLAAEYTVGMVASKMIYVLVGYIGFLFIDKYQKFNLWPFVVLIVMMYAYYEMVYFGVVDEYNHKEMEHTLEHSSSNGIAICLLCVFSYYYILNNLFDGKHELPLLIFSYFNFYLIIVQESRAGLMVTLMYCILTTYDFINSRKKKVRFSIFRVLLFGILAGVVLLYLYSKFAYEIDYYLLRVGVRETIDSGATDEGRWVLILAFFNDMDLGSFLFGHPYKKVFAGFDNRTYNALFDFWNMYGFVPFLLFCYYAIRRITNRKNYSIPLIKFLPLFFYSMFESFLVKGLWMTIVFVFLFLKKERKEMIKIIDNNKTT